MKLEYTPEEKNRLEIEKLYAEVADLRSWMRRWLGTLGGVLGIVTAGVSVLVATHEISRSSREAETKLQQAAAALAQAQRLDSERALLEITTQKDAKSKELEAKNKEIAARNTDLAEVGQALEKIKKALAAAEQASRSLVNAVKPQDFSPKALDLIVQFEGINQPSQWVGGPSGITIGLGYDLGLTKKEDFENDWKDQLTPEQIRRLESAIGTTGSEARELAAKFTDIKISREAARDVFKRITIPRYQAEAAQIYPGYEKLPLDVQGVLVSLIYNLGPSLIGEHRQHMRAIRDKVAAGDVQGIANEIRAMKKQWEVRLPGLAARREGEAALVESAARK